MYVASVALWICNKVYGSAAYGPHNTDSLDCKECMRRHSTPNPRCGGVVSFFQGRFSPAASFCFFFPRSSPPCKSRLQCERSLSIVFMSLLWMRSPLCSPISRLLLPVFCRRGEATLESPLQDIGLGKV